MTEKRYNEILNEAKRRFLLVREFVPVNEWQSSALKFEMELGLYGYPFKRPMWMRGEKYIKFVTWKEFLSDQYTEIIEKVFEVQQKIKSIELEASQLLRESVSYDEKNDETSVDTTYILRIKHLFNSSQEIIDTELITEK